ncbi:MAG: (d)CMP kinase, partial [Clostridiales bacterium]|nr:(d)CMP kinase [Clostridiales bacterium]
IRTQEAGLAASTISRYRPVREWLVARQRQIARTQSMVLDGRDIGTVVLPDAKVKVYLTATPEERARRRHQELLEAGQEAVYQDVLEQLKTRDLQDQTRAVDPLRPARGAVMLDTTHLSFEQTVQTILDLVALA